LVFITCTQSRACRFVCVCVLTNAKSFAKYRELLKESTDNLRGIKMV